MIAVCQFCGREFTAKRSTAKFCSPACRLKAHRGGYYVGEYPPPPSANLTLTKEEVLEVVDRAHVCAEDMSRAAIAMPAPLCHQLGRCAKAFEGALRREGL